MAGLEIRMEYSGGRTGMIRALAAAQALAWLITAALLLAVAFVMWKFQPDMGKMQLGIYGIYVLSCLFAGRYTGKREHAENFCGGCAPACCILGFWPQYLCFQSVRYSPMRCTGYLHLYFVRLEGCSAV